MSIEDKYLNERNPDSSFRGSSTKTLVDAYISQRLRELDRELNKKDQDIKLAAINQIKALEGVLDFLNTIR